MSTQARQSTASAMASSKIRRCFITLIIVILPVIAILSFSLSPSSHTTVLDFISSLPVSNHSHHLNSTDSLLNSTDSPLNSSNLLDLANLDSEAPILRSDINYLLNLENLIDDNNFNAIWGDDLDLDLDSDSFRHLHSQSLPILHYWSLRRFSPHSNRPEQILSDLLPFLRLRIKYSSCAVVGNSGIVLTADHGADIDSHAAVIRLNNAAAGGKFSSHVGKKTTISFVNSNVLHECARRSRRCLCHGYNAAVPVVFYICQPRHLLDYISCNETGLAPFLVTDPGFDRLCGRIVKYYSLRRWFSGGGARLEEWSAAHEGRYFHYSSGMQAVVMAVGVCEKVSLYGFGKAKKHHYHTKQKEELKLHDYEAEYEFYRDLVESPEAIPFLTSSPDDGGVRFKFPKVVIHR